MEAMQAQSIDVVKRMKEITQVMQTPEQVLEAQGVGSEDIEGTFIFRIILLSSLPEPCSICSSRTFSKLLCYIFLILADMLDELQEHVESIDMANGEVLSLLNYIKSLLDVDCSYDA